MAAGGLHQAAEIWRRGGFYILVVWEGRQGSRKAVNTEKKERVGLTETGNGAPRP